MRIDKFLKETGIIKRRALAKELLDNGHIRSGETILKASYTVRRGDIIKIQKGDSSWVFEVLEIPARNLKKDERALYYKMLEKAHEEEGDDL